MRENIREYSPVATINTPQDFFDRHTIYHGTWGYRMMRALSKRGHTPAAMAGIFDIIKREQMTWDQFREIDWHQIW